MKNIPMNFMAEAVKLVLEQGLSVAQTARKLGIPKGPLNGWVSCSTTSIYHNWRSSLGHQFRP